jgi:hypothetical protein
MRPSSIDIHQCIGGAADRPANVRMAQRDGDAQPAQNELEKRKAAN